MAEEISEGLNSKMLYDLRQVYAVEILRPILVAIEWHREKNEFSQWFEKLTMSLHTNINQKLDGGEKKEYEAILTKTINEINRLRDTFSGHNKDPQKVYQVKIALKELEMWLKGKMEKHGLFGKGDEESESY
jgi:hypothetical protein